MRMTVSRAIEIANSNRDKFGIDFEVTHSLDSDVLTIRSSDTHRPVHEMVLYSTEEDSDGSSQK